MYTPAQVVNNKVTKHLKIQLAVSFLRQRRHVDGHQQKVSLYQ